MIQLLFITVSILCWGKIIDASKAPLSMLINACCAGNTYEVEVEPSDTVGEVCSALCKSNHLKIEQQSVHYRGSVVDKRKTIRQVGIRAGGTLSIKATARRKQTADNAATAASTTDTPINAAGNSIPKTTVKSSASIKKNIDVLKRGLMRGSGSGEMKTAKNEQTPQWGVKQLQDMIAKGQAGDNKFLESMAASVKSNPMGVMSELMGSTFLEDLVSDDSALESMRLATKQNMKQYAGMFPEVAAQAKQLRMLTSSPVAFKAAVKMAALSMKRLRASSSSSGPAAGAAKNAASPPSSEMLTKEVDKKKEAAAAAAHVADKIPFEDDDSH